ncbi:uncharacterized protein LOC143879734 [Tasmannia lanceolata]|uniref:uncharacterized protein LOC143879734 n=1 Tax=Tasmannia lanceolata TaxID=3420 RepID=UPI0040628874
MKTMQVFGTENQELQRYPYGVLCILRPIKQWLKIGNCKEDLPHLQHPVTSKFMSQMQHLMMTHLGVLTVKQPSRSNQHSIHFPRSKFSVRMSLFSFLLLGITS